MNSDLKAQLRELYITGAKVIFKRHLCCLLQYMISGMITNFTLHGLDSKKMISIKALILSFFLQEIDVQGKKAIMIFVPVPQLRAYQKIQTRLVRELEKKFSGKHVVFIAQVGCGVFFYFDIIMLSSLYCSWCTEIGRASQMKVFDFDISCFWFHVNNFWRLVFSMKCSENISLF